MSRRRRAFALALGAALWTFVAGPLAAQQLDREALAAALPTPDLAGLEPAAAEQLAAHAAHVAELVAETETGPAELARQIGELGRLYLASGLAAAAEGCLVEAERLAPREPSWPHLLGYLRQRDGRPEAAARSFERVLSIAPGTVAALVRLGPLYAATGRPEAAEWVLRDALERRPGSAAAQAVLGEVLVAAGRPREAVELLETALARQPGADRLHRPLAAAYRALGHDDRARHLEARAGAGEPPLADPWIDSLDELVLGERLHLARGRAAYAAGRFAEAAAEFERAAEASPASAAPRINRAAALERLGDVDGALAEYRRATAIAPEESAAWVELGILEARQGELDAARAALERATALDPANGVALFHLAEVHRRAGDREAAVRGFRRSAELAPPGEMARFREAQLLAELGRHAEARDRLEEGWAAQPRSALLALALARQLAASPDPAVRDGARAVDILERAPVRRSLRTYETLAMAHAEAGRCERAVEWQSQAWEAALDSDRPELAAELEAMVEHYREARPCRYPVSGRPAAEARLEPETR